MDEACISRRIMYMIRVDLFVFGLIWAWRSEESFHREQRILHKNILDEIFYET